jgi:hypothetical protein
MWLVREKALSKAFVADQTNLNIQTPPIDWESDSDYV